MLTSLIRLAVSPALWTLLAGSSIAIALPPTDGYGQSDHPATPPVVYVHYDYMAGYDPTLGAYVSFAPPDAAIDTVIRSFRSHGVTLHVDPRHNVIPYHEVVIPDWNPAWQHVSASCTGTDAVGFAALKAAYFTPPDNHPWHYAIFVHNAQVPDTGDGSACPVDPICGAYPDPLGSGVSELPGVNFMVAFGADVDQGFSISLGRWAGTFMHELGHNFGLMHGGIYDYPQRCLAFKPNYVSVMNYFYQDGIAYSTNGNPGLPGTGLRIDYSDEMLTTLDESDLNEPTGVGSVLHPNDIIEYLSSSRFATAFASGAVDWNLDGNATGLHIAVDLDNDNGTPDNFLLGFDDWAYIRQFVRIPAYQAGHVHGATSVE